MDRAELKQIIGQLFMVGFNGTSPDRTLIKLVKEHHVGGVVLQAHNCDTPQQVAGLVESLQAVVPGPPLIMATSCEGGEHEIWSRMLTPFPAMARLGEIGKVATTFRVGEIMARELAVLGIRMNLAPVLDVDSEKSWIGVRSFGSASDLCGVQGAAFIRGLQREGVAACPKHFPGLGAVIADYDHVIPLIDRDLPTLNQVDLTPFRFALQSRPAALLISRAVYLVIHHRTQQPALFSPMIVQRMVRNELGFEGLIIADDVAMPVLREIFSADEIVQLAMEAGIDMLKVSSGADVCIELIERMIQGVLSHSIRKSRVLDACKRVLALKKQYCNAAFVMDVQAIESIIRSSAHQRFQMACMGRRD